MKILSYHGVLTASDFRDLAEEHLPCEILVFLGRTNEQMNKSPKPNLIGNTKVLKHWVRIFTLLLLATKVLRNIILSFVCYKNLESFAKGDEVLFDWNIVLLSKQIFLKMVGRIALEIKITK